MKPRVRISTAFAFCFALVAAAAFAGENAPSELPQGVKPGKMSPSTSALRNPNDPDTKAAETRSLDQPNETGRGDKPGEAGTTNLETGAEKSPEEAAK